MSTGYPYLTSSSSSSSGFLQNPPVFDNDVTLGEPTKRFKSVHSVDVQTTTIDADAIKTKNITTDLVTTHDIHTDSAAASYAEITDLRVGAIIIGGGLFGDVTGETNVEDTLISIVNDVVAVRDTLNGNKNNFIADRIVATDIFTTNINAEEMKTINLEVNAISATTATVDTITGTDVVVTNNINTKTMNAESIDTINIKADIILAPNITSDTIQTAGITTNTITGQFAQFDNALVTGLDVGVELNRNKLSIDTTAKKLQHGYLELSFRGIGEPDVGGCLIQLGEGSWGHFYSGGYTGGGSAGVTKEYVTHPSFQLLRDDEDPPVGLVFFPEDEGSTVAKFEVKALATFQRVGFIPGFNDITVGVLVLSRKVNDFDTGNAYGQQTYTQLEVKHRFFSADEIVDVDLTGVQSVEFFVTGWGSMDTQTLEFYTGGDNETYKKYRNMISVKRLS